MGHVNTLHRCATLNYNCLIIREAVLAQVYVSIHGRYGRFNGVTDWSKMVHQPPPISDTIKSTVAHSYNCKTYLTLN